MWLPDSFQDNFKVPHQSIFLSLVFCHLGTPIGNDEKAGKNEDILHTAKSASSDKYVFANRAFLIEECFVTEWSVQRPSPFPWGVLGENGGEGIWKRVCKQVDSLLREGETGAAHLCFSPLPAPQNAGEPCFRA